MDGWGKWFRDSLDKFLLTGLFIGQVSLVVWLIQKQTEQGYVNWAQNLASTVLGTLLGLITGKLLRDQSTNTTVSQVPGGDLKVNTTGVGTPSPVPSVTVQVSPSTENSENPISGKEV